VVRPYAGGLRVDWVFCDDGDRVAIPVDRTRDRTTVPPARTDELRRVVRLDDLRCAREELRRDGSRDGRRLRARSGLLNRLLD
jgi:hypothetical protein